jgi:hypothetical protein
MKIDFKFRNVEQEKFFWSVARNNCFSGGFNNGKSFAACQRMFLFQTTFENYRYAVARRKYKNLRTTTMQTYFKICPKTFIYRHDEQNGFTVLKNKSLSYWMHLDVFDEEDMRGLEINSILVDQAEEIDESTIIVLDARIGRWDGAIVPEHLLLSMTPKDYLNPKMERDEILDAINKYSLWPRNPFGDKFLVPNHSDILCNPTEAGELHWIYRWYHPDSLERKPNYFFIERETDERLGDAATMAEMKGRDEEFVDTYFKGKWGASKAQIHKINDLSLIKYSDYAKEEWDKLLTKIRSRAAIYRVLDHGETGITCCTWWAALGNIHICIGEYYISNTLISDNRRNISDITIELGIEPYLDLADPDIFKFHSQKEGAYTRVADEYNDMELTDAPGIFWTAADNNELATRNRINEFLALSVKYEHPITKQRPAPRIFYLMFDPTNWPHGADKVVTQTKMQRKKLLGSDNGKNIYSIERDDTIVDHAYDTERYYVAHHAQGLVETVKKPPRMSMAYYKALSDRRRSLERTF